MADTDARKYTINGKDIKQPDTPVGNSWETTYTEDTNRVLSGQILLDPLFTVENLSFTFSHISCEDVSHILKLIIPTQGNPHFSLTYFSAYHGKWQENDFYVGKGSISLSRAVDGHYDKFSFNAIGVNPL